MTSSPSTSPSPARSPSPSTRHPRGQLHESQTEFNASLSKIRAAIERSIAHLKTWRMLGEEGGRLRLLDKFEAALKAVIGLFFFNNY